MDMEFDENRLRMIQQRLKEENVKIEYNELNDTFDIINADGKTLEQVERTDFDIIGRASVEDTKVGRHISIDNKAGRDLDGYDIPNDTPAERIAEEKQINERNEGDSNDIER